MTEKDTQFSKSKDTETIDILKPDEDTSNDPKIKMSDKDTPNSKDTKTNGELSPKKDTPFSRSTDKQPIGILKSDRQKMKWISFCVITQCVIVFVGTMTVLQCVYKPNEGLFEIDVLARIMYLFDTEACGAQLSTKQINELVLSDATYGLSIVPIKRRPVLLTVLTKISGKTRNYMKMSCVVHFFWLLGAIVLKIYSYTEDLDYLKQVLTIFYCMTSLVTCFDLSMAVVHIAHIQQSMTKEMILRYSGWGMAPRVKHTENFGGWVPMIASVCWMRGVLLMLVNMYCCRTMRFIFKNIKKREVKSRIKAALNAPYPDMTFNNFHKDTLVIKTGQYSPSPMKE